MPIPCNPNLQLIYVSDIERSTAVYKRLFHAEPLFTSPRYVTFLADGEALFAIWTGGTKLDFDAPRFAEIGIMVPSNQAVEALFQEWKKYPDIKFLREPYIEVFGLTFLVQDPDGHMIRVSPLD